MFILDDCLTRFSLLYFFNKGWDIAATPSTRGTIRIGTIASGPAIIAITPINININGKSIKATILAEVKKSLTPSNSLTVCIIPDFLVMKEWSWFDI